MTCIHRQVSGKEILGWSNDKLFDRIGAGTDCSLI